MTIVNISGLTQKLSEEFVVGEVQAAEVVIPEHCHSGPVIRRLSLSQDEERRKKLLERIQLQEVPDADAGQLCTFLANNHSVQPPGRRAWRHISRHNANRHRGCTSPETDATSDAVHCPRGSRPAAVGHAARWSDTAVELPLVKPGSYGSKEIR